MFTLGTDEGKKQAIKRSLSFIPITFFVMAAGFIYELFGHGVYSFYMIYAFVFPLFMGSFFWLLISFTKEERHISSIFVNLWYSAMATFTIGFLFKGALEIYGTSYGLSLVYFVLGIILTLSAIVALLVK